MGEPPKVAIVVEMGVKSGAGNREAPLDTACRMEEEWAEEEWDAEEWEEEQEEEDKANAEQPLMPAVHFWAVVLAGIVLQFPPTALYISSLRASSPSNWRQFRTGSAPLPLS